MSFLTDLFEGKTSNLTNDLFGSPTAIAETLGAIAAPFALPALPALAGLAVPEVGTAAASFGAGGDASGLGSLLSSLGLTADTVDPTLLGAASAAPANLATGVGGTAGAATPTTALGFAGDVPNAAGAASAFNAPGIGYFPDFSVATLGSSIPGGDPGVASLAGLTSADLPQIPGDALALGGYAGPASQLGGTALSGLTAADLPGIPSEALASYGLTPGTAGAPGASALDATSLGAAPATSGPVTPATGGGGGGGAAAPATSATPAAAPASFLDKWGGTLAGIGLTGAAGIGGTMLAPKIASSLGLNTPPGSAPLTNVATQAQQLGTQQTAYGNILEQYQLTGKLPPAAQAEVDQTTQAAIATIKSKFAAMGMGNSAQEAQAIAQVQQQASINAFNIAQQMAQQGQAAISGATTDLGIQESVYANLMNAVIAQDTALSNSISSFASAVGGGLAVGTGQALAKKALS